VVGGTDCNRGNMQQMVQHSVNPAFLGDKFMCSGNDSGKSVMQKTL